MASQKIPMLVGISGYCEGVKFPLQYGKTLVVGRSRSADLSLRRLGSYLSLPAEERDKDEAFRTVSGRHFEVTLYNLGAIEIRNLSGNGTLVDGKPVDTFLVEDISDQSHKIEIGINEKMSLELVEQDEEGEESVPVALGEPEGFSKDDLAASENEPEATTVPPPGDE